MSDPQVGIELSKFQDMLAASVGLGLAIPLLFDVLSRIADRILTRVNRRLQTLEGVDDVGFELLAEARLHFQRRQLKTLNEYSLIATANIIVSVMSFVMIAAIVHFGEVKISFFYQSMLFVLCFVPICSGSYMYYKWDRMTINLRRSLNQTI